MAHGVWEKCTHSKVQAWKLIHSILPANMEVDNPWFVEEHRGVHDFLDTVDTNGLSTQSMESTKTCKWTCDPPKKNEFLSDMSSACSTVFLNGSSPPRHCSPLRILPNPVMNPAIHPFLSRNSNPNRLVGFLSVEELLPGSGDPLRSFESRSRVRFIEIGTGRSRITLTEKLPKLSQVKVEKNHLKRN